MSSSVLNRAIFGTLMGMLVFTQNLYAETAFRGVNFLQTSAVAFANALTDQSLDRLVNVGANTVAIVAFMEMNASDSTVVYQSQAVTDEQLVAGIRKAKTHGLSVILKPQLLVRRGWAGEINPGEEADWKRWFASYAEALRNYAEIARREQVDMLVIGTELKLADARPEWANLIGMLRGIYPGKLTYAAHNVEGAENFKFWGLLDYVAVTLYPPMGENSDRVAMKDRATQTLTLLQAIAERQHKPLLIAEVGVASFDDAQNTPWEVPKRCVKSDVLMQANLVGAWLAAVREQTWIAGTLIWNWFSDPYEGGRHNTDFTVQNKPAESVMRCEWTGKCLPAF